MWGCGMEGDDGDLITETGSVLNTTARLQMPFLYLLEYLDHEKLLD